MPTTLYDHPAFNPEHLLPIVSQKYSTLRLIGRTLVILVALFFAPLGCQVVAHYSGHGEPTAWWDLRRDSSNQAPDAAFTDDAIIQVYSARAARWRGAFGVHTWFATKRQDENHYTRLEVIGYALRWGGNTVRIRSGRPDNYWFGNKPYLLREIRGGADVDEMIDRIHYAAQNYLYQDRYKVWPGPNSNTFTATLAREVPELELELPATAIGKDFLLENAVFAKSPSGDGLQFSLRGLFGLIVGVEEGVEVNMLGLTAGLDLSPPAIKLPGVGRVGFSDFERKVIR